MGNSFLHRILLVLILTGSLVVSAQTTITSWVSQGSDDAEERFSDGNVDLGSTDLELGSDSGTAQIVGHRRGQ